MKAFIDSLNDTVDSFDDNYPRIVCLTLRTALEKKQRLRGVNMPESEVLLLKTLKEVRKPAVRRYKA